MLATRTFQPRDPVRGPAMRIPDHEIRSGTPFSGSSAACRSQIEVPGYSPDARQAQTGFLLYPTRPSGVAIPGSVRPAAGGGIQ